jgi:glycosyltransferase involved in cell wall biosynthesis
MTEPAISTNRSDTPNISVILPIFNAAPYLDQALSSVQEQTFANIEIICLNDGSTDDSLTIMHAHAVEDERIRIIDKENQGYGATCNRGLREARGQYIAIIEPDDWIESHMFEDMLSFAKTFDSFIDIIKTPYWRIWMADTPQQRKLNCSYKNRITPRNQPFTIDDPGAAHLLCHHPSIWSALYRREFLEKQGIDFNEYPGAGWADNPFLIETLCQAEAIIYLDKAYYCYREDTPEKAASFAKRSPLLPIERWNDMKDVLERLNVTDRNIQRAHNSRGFTYLSGVLEEVDLSKDDLDALARRMFARMDENLVLSDPAISPAMKKLFMHYRNIEGSSPTAFPYIGSLLKAGCYNLANTGLSNTAFMVKNYFRKKSQIRQHR